LDWVAEEVFVDVLSPSLVFITSSLLEVNDEPIKFAHFILKYWVRKNMGRVAMRPSVEVECTEAMRQSTLP
jgi:hypothetical protein